MESADIFDGAISTNKKSLRDAILSIKEETLIPLFLEYLDAHGDVALHDAVVRSIEENNSSSHLVVAIVLHNEAIIYLRKNRLDKVVGSLISSSHSIGRFVGGNEQKTLVAKINSGKRHAETYKLKAEVLDYWEKNIDRTLSADKAATILATYFSPLLSFRTLSDYVSVAKKRRSPSTP
ncbi:hypothetical protein [Collimonas humicola]|uniref:hypothetical protein n=1 Tax=Collimonas humicola TaxID=2825886 RepID=UPI001B8ADE49|nr:hypothetical protein [Collimonas humicola]